MDTVLTIYKCIQTWNTHAQWVSVVLSPVILPEVLHLSGCEVSDKKRACCVTLEAAAPTSAVCVPIDLLSLLENVAFVLTHWAAGSMKMPPADPYLFNKGFCVYTTMLKQPALSLTLLTSCLFTFSLNWGQVSASRNYCLELFLTIFPTLKVFLCHFSLAACFTYRGIWWVWCLMSLWEFGVCIFVLMLWHKVQKDAKIINIW